MPAAPASSHGTARPNVVPTAHALNLYLEEINGCYVLCQENEKITAIHTRGEELQVYRQFDARRDIVEMIERSGMALPAWNEWPFWKPWAKSLEKLEGQVIKRMEKHGQQRAVFTRGVCWECRPILIHVYKFEPDPFVKIELILPNTPINGCPDDLPLKVIASAIRCHDFLVPRFVAVPRPPYAGHEAKFETLNEYLQRTMPTDAYATRLFTVRAAGDG